MHKHVIVRLVTYYVAAVSLFGGLFYAFPVLGEYVTAERARQGARAALIKGIEQGDPHVTKVELMRTKTKKPVDA